MRGGKQKGSGNLNQHYGISETQVSLNPRGGGTKSHCAALLFHFAAELSNENIVGIVKKEEFLCNPLRSPSFRPNPRKNGQDLGFDRSSGARPPSHQNLTENLRRNPPVAEIKIVKHFTFSFDLLLSSKQSYHVPQTFCL